MESFLKKFRVSENEDLINPVKDEKYSVEEDSIADFWHELCLLTTNSTRFCLYEVIKDKATINAIIHINYPTEEDTPLPASFIRKLVYSFQNVLGKSLNLKKESHLLCSVSTASAGLDHFVLLQFPYFTVNKKLRDEVLYKLISNEIRLNNAIEDLHTQPANDFLDRIFYDEVPIHGSIYMKTGKSFTFYNFYRQIKKLDDIYDNDEQLTFSEVFRKSESALYQASLVPKDWFKNQSSESTHDTESSFSKRSYSQVKSDSDKLSRFTESTLPSRVSLTDGEDFWVPFFLSVHFPRNIAYLRKEVKKELEEEQKKAPESDEIGDTKLKEIVDLCNIIPQKIVTKEPYVSIIGRICYNTSGGRKEGFATWKKVCTLPTEWIEPKDENTEDDRDSSRLSSISGSTLCSRTSEAEESENEEEIQNLSDLLSRRPGENPDFENDDHKDPYVRLWFSFGTDPTSHYTSTSLHYLAYSIEGDKPGSIRDKYKQYLIASSYNLLKNASTLLDSFVAELFHYHYRFNFLYDTSKNGSWWYYKNHKWEKDKNGLIVHKYISGPFTTRILESINHFNQKFVLEKDEEKRKNNAKFIENLQKLVAECQKHPYKNKLTNEMREKYINTLFNKIKDENPRLTVMKNGVIEIAQRPSVMKNDAVEIGGPHVYFRNGLPEDYATYSTRINYIPAKKRDKVKEKHIRVYMNQLFPNREVRHWAWKYDVSALLGRPRDKNVVFLVGYGGNSKSGHVKLKEAAWGDYLIKGDNKMILAHVAQKASGPEPEKIRMRGRRIVIFQELDGKEPLHGGNLRKLSGGDSQGGVRDSYDGADEMIETSQMAKVAVMLNKLPPISEGGSVEATWERAKVVFYDSKWTETAFDEYEEQWKTNRFKPREDIDERITSWAETYFSMLVSSWPAYWNGKPRLPDIAPIVEATKQYRSLTDLYLNYYTERIEMVQKEDGTVDRSVKKTIATVYSDFKNWYQINFSKKPPPRNVFMEEMRSKGMAYEGNDYIGIKFKSQMKEDSKSDGEETEQEDE